MNIVTVSPKYQIVIPKTVRVQLGIMPGEKIQVVSYESRIELIPVKSMSSARGFLSGIDTRITREEDRL